MNTPTSARRIIATLAFVAVLVAIIIVLFQGCDASQPAGPELDFGSSSGGAQPLSTLTPAASPGDSVSCSVTGNRAKTLRSVSVDGLVVSGTCFATSVSDGRLFCKVYLDERGGSPSTNADIGEPWTLLLPDFDEHTLVIDFEMDVDGDGQTDCQADGTNTTVQGQRPPKGCEPGPPPDETCVFDAKACRWQCEPACDVDELRYSAQQECGDTGFDLDVEACSFTCKPEPPSCDDENPPSYEITDTSLKLRFSEDDGSDDSSSSDGGESGVEVHACFAVSNLEAVGEIFWSNGGASRVKKSVRMKVKCEDGTRRECLTFKSSAPAHLCRNGARYQARLNPIDGGILPTKVVDISCPEQQ